MLNKTFPVFGHSVEVMISSKSSEGEMTVIVQTTPPGGGPPPHFHQNENEVLMALDGEFELFSNNQWTPMICGQTNYLRHGETHTFRNRGTSMGSATPGGLDESLEEISSIRMPDDKVRLLAISEKYGILFPSLHAPETVDKKAFAAA